MEKENVIFGHCQGLPLPGIKVVYNSNINIAVPLNKKGQFEGIIGRVTFAKENVHGFKYSGTIEIKEGDCYVDCPQHNQQGKDNSICANCKWNYLI